MPVTQVPPLYSPLGDSAITVRFGEGVTDELSEIVFRSARHLAAARIAGVAEIVPAYATLAVFYDSLVIGYEEMQSLIDAALAEHADSTSDVGSRSPAIVRVQVRYDGEDLDDVARRTGLGRDEIAEMHSSRAYRAMVIGFVPGFAYLGGLDPRLSLPRRDSPRKRVPPGSVAIADLQTAVYPSATPGGWHIIGTTDAIMFDPHREPPAMLRVGDTVWFDPVQ